MGAAKHGLTVCAVGPLATVSVAIFTNRSQRCWFPNSIS